LILAQTNASVHVLSHAPLKLLFSIDSPGADRAHFSPDSKRVSMAFPDMRVESWDIATQKRESVHDLIDYRGCWVSALAADGRTFACMKLEDTGGVGLTLLDVETEKPIYENKKFNEFPGWGNRGDIVFSPDGTLMLALLGGKTFAYDLTQRHEIAMHGDLGNMIAWKAAFVGNTKIAFACGNGKAQANGAMLYTMCLDSFPGGDKLGRFPIGDQWVRGISQGDFVLIGPAGENAAILIDPATGTIQRAFRSSQVDLYGQALASESSKGGVALKETSAGSPVTVDLPVSPLRPLAAGDFSADGRFLAYSHSSRGTLWDLEQNKQVSLLRPFSGLRFDDQDRAWLHLITSFQKPGANLMLDARTGTQTPGAPFEEDQSLLSGVLVNFKALDKGFRGIVNNMEMDVSDPTDGKQLWTRHFPKGRPEIYESDRDTLVLMYDLRTEDGATELSHHTDKVVRSSDTQKEWLAEGLVLEIVSARTGEVQRILQTPTRPAGIFREDHRWADVFGNYIAVHGNLNNTVVYRLSDGVRTAAFYGRVLGGDGAQGLLAVANRNQELTVYDAATGKQMKRMILDHQPRVASFVASKNSLLVLTATQRVYTIPLSSSPAGVTAAAN
jgi:WD40 repeat protein